MNRYLIPLLCFSLFVGCQTVQEQRALERMPEQVEPRPYIILLDRARTQVKLATEAFYSDAWMDVEDAAKALQQTAAYMGSASKVPAKIESTLPQKAEELGEAATELFNAARKKDTRAITTILHRIHETLHALHANDGVPKNNETDSGENL